MQKSESEMYDVSKYNDTELYDILDVFNPSDRELEAKILFLFRKYKNMQTTEGDKLASFFQDIYDHFFENNQEDEGGDVEDVENLEGVEDVEEEEENDGIGYKEGLTNLNDNKLSTNINTVDIGNIKIKPGTISNEFYTNDKGNTKLDNKLSNKIYYSNDNGNTFTSSTAPPQGFINSQNAAEKVNYTTQLNYTAGTNNPILKETITRVISIDSQYRADKTKLPTEFTFDLSDPLKDVVSLSLYSVQIPYTWYTIAKSYGSNFFYIKGTSPGLNNGNHDLQFSIPPGNYSPSDLITAVNKSFTDSYSVYSDISLGNTNISYNSNTSLSLLNINITKQYGENSYHLDFPFWSTPNIYDQSGNLDDVARSQSSIPSFLGLNKSYYNLNTVNSGLLSNYDIQNNDYLSFTLDPISTTINIIKYTSTINTKLNESETFVETKSPYIVIPITLTLPTDGSKHSRNEIIADLSNQIFNNPELSNESYISLIYSSSEEDIRYGSYYYEFKIKPNRYTTNNITNSKIFLQFPDESKIAYFNSRIWTGPTSCLRFLDLSNELQTIESETPIVKQTNVYTILPGPYVVLNCVNDNFISESNNLSFSLQLNLINNTDIYTVSQIIDSLNAGIIQSTISYPFLRGPTSSSYTYSDLAGKPPNYTYCYVDYNYKFSLSLDIEKDFDNTNYEIDFTDSSLNSLFNLGYDINGNILNNSTLTDISGVAGRFDRINITNGSVLFNIKPLQNGMGNELDNIGPIVYNATSPSNNTFVNYGTLANTVQSYLLNYTYKGKTIFKNNSTFKISLQSSSTIIVAMNLYITRRITSTDYNIQFIDDSNSPNFWNDLLQIDTNTFIDNHYDLSGNNVNLIKFNNDNAIILKASQPIEIVTIHFESIPNTFSFIADDDGVYSKKGENNITITIPPLDQFGNYIRYTRDLLITTMNSILVNTIANGTYFYLTPPDENNDYFLRLRININKIYRANDYRIVFYDTVSFVRCFVGAKGVQNTTWDSTLGWILGFRNSTNYYLSDYKLDSKNTITIDGETAVTTNLYNYFLICLDDYNLNHLDDGLVTITGQDTTAPLPSYAARSNFQCDPVTKVLTFNPQSTAASDKNSKLTQNQIFSLTQKVNAKNSSTSNILGGQSAKSFGRGPFSEDVFAFIPMKVAGLANGSYFIEYGGTLQNNNRKYFGPVNIHRMKVKLISDKGNIVDLNGTNWSFSFLCEQLYKKDKKK